MREERWKWIKWARIPAGVLLLAGVAAWGHQAAPPPGKVVVGGSSGAREYVAPLGCVPVGAGAYQLDNLTSHRIMMYRDPRCAGEAFAVVFPGGRTITPFTAFRLDPHVVPGRMPTPAPPGLPTVRIPWLPAGLLPSFLLRPSGG